MFPLYDVNPHVRKPIVTYLLVITNVLVWWRLQGFGSEEALKQSICDWGFVPGALTLDVFTSRLCLEPPLHPELTVLSSMFMHGGWFHLISNMWFLHVFGNNIEDRLGHLKFLLFYLFAGFSAAFLQFLFDLQSTIPMVGASGAVSGVMGFYWVLFPRVKIQTLFVFGFFIRTFLVPASFMLGYWFIFQLLGGVLQSSGMGGVAYWAHIGGFLAGIGIGRMAK